MDRVGLNNIVPDGGCQTGFAPSVANNNYAD